MPKIARFSDFEAFQASREFVRETGLLLRTPEFRPHRILSIQMERASISVLSNFAEGFERDGNTEFVQFLAISKGSVGELRAQLIYSLDLGIIEQKTFEKLDLLGESATRLIGGLMSYLSQPHMRGRKFVQRKRAEQLANSEPRTANREPRTANSKPRTANCGTANREQQTANRPYH
jgi:four helix bundle protein